MRMVMMFAAVAGLWIGLFTIDSQAEERREHDARLRVVGIRGAISGPNKGESFHAYELFATFPLKWRWQWPQGWDLSSNIETLIGALSGAGKTGLIAGAAPGITIRRRNWRRWSILANIGVALVSEHNFRDQAIGGPVQFILSPGVNYQLSPKWHLTYRYRHTSNSALYHPNPGLELHFLGLSYGF